MGRHRKQYLPQTKMETPPRVSERQLLRAARSLHYNRERLTLIQARIERATETLESHLAIAGMGVLSLGCYEIVLVEGELELTWREPENDLSQLPLPEAETERDSELLVGDHTANSPQS